MTRLLPGRSTPLGANYDGHGTNFAVHSDIAEAVAVCVFSEDGEETQYWLDAHTGSIHHGYLTDVNPGTRYGLRVAGPWAPSRGLWCNPAKLLIDPYANAVDGTVSWDRAVYGFQVHDMDLAEPHDSAPFVPKGIVVDHSFDWGQDAPPRRPWHETVLYETHVRAISMLHPDVPAELRGTYLGLAAEPVVAHLLKLGVTAVELLPVHEYVHDHALDRHGLRNHWGYQPIAYFAPHHEYAASPRAGDQVTEFKQMVKTLHEAGLEVILDVVYNHTGESHDLGPNLAFRGIDNPAYYRLSDEDRRHYLDFSGVGNTINTDHPATLRMIADSMRHWVETYHVDGFRFDLATTLARSGLEFDPAAPFLHLVHQDPVLNRVKLIAEPWDVGPGGYRLGGFPVEWREWNDRYRDTVRDYWRGTPGTLRDMARRVTGSADIFGHAHRRPPTASINFVTSHDGFTLADLVSYERKHNAANRQNNEDGHNDNRSWNTGVEGPTDDPEIVTLRDRRRRSLFATLLLSQGVPMVLGGDELSRTQHGNNNAFAQDNETSWYHWDETDTAFLEFAAHAIAVRRDNAQFRQTSWLQGAPREVDGPDDVAWFTPTGRRMGVADWESDRSMALTIHFSSADSPTGPPAMVMLNGDPESARFAVPAPARGRWRVRLDTAAHDGRSSLRAMAGDVVIVQGFGLVVLEQEQPCGFCSPHRSTRPWFASAVSPTPRRAWRRRSTTQESASRS